MTRTPSDIIEEFELLIDKDLMNEKDMMALVVGFETETRFIFNHEPDKLDALTSMVESGGIPIGYIRIERSREEISVESRALIEYADEVQVKEYLEDLCQTTGKMIVSGTGRNKVPEATEKNT
jgi:hypothetical protein